MAENKPPITTRAELDHLIENRKYDPQIPENNHPRPSWVADPNDAKRVHMRMRERRIRYLENRLDGASRNMERNWDQNR